ncbi:hypothetical protein [Sporosalibacterium faouarense]|uniref:hypothetical protein n=1 Tax=Sporosalibacterium faouarense TaxID=516123 RepID=UPI00192AFB7A|nr:hypothetical protein [Sporosalibacterium faouarense]
MIKLRNFTLYILIVISLGFNFATTYSDPSGPKVDLGKYLDEHSELFEISGRISLPEGEVAPEGGVKVRIYLPLGLGETYETFYIEEGENFVEYSLSEKAMEVRLPYLLLNDDYGYYIKAFPILEDGEENKDLVRKLNENNEADNINFELEPCNSIIYGKISFPNDFKCTRGGRIIKITAISKDIFSTDSNDMEIPLYFSREILFPEGKNSIDYFLPVKPNSRYSLQYSFNESPPPGYENTGFFHSDFSQMISVEDGPLQNIDIPLIHKVIFKGNYSKRALTLFESLEIESKIERNIINLEYKRLNNKLKFKFKSDYLGKLDETEDKYIQNNINKFKLLGYNVYCYKDEDYNSTELIMHLSKDKKEFDINPISEGTYNYYVTATYEKGLESLPSNIVTVDYNFNPIKSK